MVVGTKSLAASFYLPGLRRLRSYQPNWFRGDVLAGATVAAYLIPQCMAYGELAGVPPIVGLWAILPPMLIDTLVGSSPQLSVGPESTTAVMTAAIAPIAARDGSDYASLSSLLALLVGIVCLLGAVACLGFLADLLSKPILVGYMAGVAVIMMTEQLGKISGISIEAESIFGEVQEFLSRFNEIHLPTLILAACVLVFLVVVQRRFPKAPGPLLAVLLGRSTTIHGLVIYRYDTPRCFANAENFGRRAMNAIATATVPVEWFVVNADAILEIDITAVDMLQELYQELNQQNITFAIARVKQDLYAQLKQANLVSLIG